MAPRLLQHQPKKFDKGFTLIEIMVALVVFGIVMAALPVAFMSHLTYNTRMEKKTGALNAAQQVLDNLRVQDPSTLPISGVVGPQAVSMNDTNYQVLTYFCENSHYCNTSTSRHIRVAVKENNETLYEVQTVFTRLK